MKVKQDKTFTPVVITIETEQELAELYLDINKVPVHNNTSKLVQQIMGETGMKYSKARGILNE